jgi:hypothetical protein
MKLALILIDKKADLPSPFKVGELTYAVYRCADGHIYIDLDTARSADWE